MQKINFLSFNHLAHLILLKPEVGPAVILAFFRLLRSEEGMLVGGGGEVNGVVSVFVFGLLPFGRRRKEDGRGT